MGDAPAVMMKGVDFSFDGELVLEDVNLSISEGDFVAVVGPNGGGKTTLMKLTLGLLKPLRGTIEVFGRSPAQSAERLGYVPQVWACRPDFPVTILDVTLMGLVGPGPASGPYSRSDGEQARQALDRVGLAQLAGHPFCDLSGGQAQRAMVARAIVSHPGLLVLDEPTAHADPAAEQAMHDLLLDLLRDMTIILVSHNLSLVSDAVENVLCVKHRVRRHPTSALSDVSGDLLRELFGDQLRVVRHDRHVEEGKGD